MTRDEAIKSLKASLAAGDEMMKSTAWSGGNFKAEAVRILLAEAEAVPPTPDHSAGCLCADCF